MASCKWCGKSGLFLSLTKNGLCKICDIEIVSDIFQKQMLINDSTQIIQASENVDTIVSRFDFIVDILNSLSKYEQKGIPTLNPPPSKALEIMSPSERDNHIVYGLDKEFGRLKLKVNSLKTNKAKVTNIQNFITKMENFQELMLDNTQLNKLSREVKKYLQIYNA